MHAHHFTGTNIAFNLYVMPIVFLLFTEVLSPSKPAQMTSMANVTLKWRRQQAYGRTGQPDIGRRIRTNLRR